MQKSERFYTTDLFPKAADENNCVCIRFKDTGGRSFNPVPFDNVFVYPGDNWKAVFTETKIEKGKLKAHQLKFAIFCAKKKLKYCVIRIYPLYFTLSTINIEGQECKKDGYSTVSQMIKAIKAL